MVRVDEAAGWVYYMARASGQRPYDTHLYRVSLEGEALTRLTDAPGQPHIRSAPSAGWTDEQRFGEWVVTLSGAASGVFPLACGCVR